MKRTAHELMHRHQPYELQFSVLQIRSEDFVTQELLYYVLQESLAAAKCLQPAFRRVKQFKVMMCIDCLQMDVDLTKRPSCAGELTLQARADLSAAYHYSSSYSCRRHMRTSAKVRESVEVEQQNGERGREST